MKHSSTRELFAYWDRRRGRRAAPERSEIEPGPIRRVLGDTFILAFDERAGHPFRLAGTRVCALFCHELKGESFLASWAPAERATMRARLAGVADEGAGMVASVTGRTADGGTLDLELLLLPLRHRGFTRARMLGALAPLSVPYWIGAAPLTDLTVGTLRHLGTAPETAPRFASASGRLRRGLLVYDGGRPK
jgi:hypothetical protein